MAVTFTRVTIVPLKFNIFLSSGSQIIRTSIGSYTGTSTGGWALGEGQGLVLGLGDNCLINPPTSVGIGGTGSSGGIIDPPVVYTFCNATQPYGRDYLNLNLKMIRANDYSFNIQVILNGNPVNCTGGSLRMSAKWNTTDTDANEVFSVSTLTGGIAYINQSVGTATVTIASSLTNVSAIPFHRIDLPYDIQYVDSTGKRYTVAYGTLTILPNISQTAP